jgi:hypothetical protein
MGDLTFRTAQYQQPWNVPYSSGVNRAIGQVPHILASHNVLHAAKTVGKLATVFEALEHREDATLTGAELQTIRDMSADLVTEALRLANLYGFDLEESLRRRVQDKNGVTYAEGGRHPGDDHAEQVLAALRCP